MSRPKPSFWLFLETKAPSNSFPTTIIFFSSLVIAIYNAPQSQLTCLYSMIAVIIIMLGLGLLLLWKDFKKLSLIFRNGFETPGKIVDVYFTWAFGTIIYEYQYEERKYRFKYGTYPNKKAKGISVGQEVMIYVNPEDPYESYIRNIYLNTF